jgi:hypothetical protein
MLQAMAVSYIAGPHVPWFKLKCCPITNLLLRGTKQTFLYPRPALTPSVMILATITRLLSTIISISNYQVLEALSG